MITKPPTAVRPRASTTALTIVDAAPATLASVSETTLPTPTTIQGTKTMINSTNFVAFGKENFEAFTAASKIWAVGVQDLSQLMAASAKASLEESVATFKALSSVKSVKEAIDLQSAYSKAAVAKALTESTKLTDASLKLTEQAMAPLTARMAVAMGSLTKAA
jgi:phasin family protein